MEPDALRQTLDTVEVEGEHLEDVLRKLNLDVGAILSVMDSRIPESRAGGPIGAAMEARAGLRTIARRVERMSRELDVLRREAEEEVPEPPYSIAHGA